VELVLDSPLSAYPESIDAGILSPNQESVHRIILGDTLDRSDVRIEAIEPSDSVHIAVTQEPSNEVAQEGKGYVVQGRYALTVRLSPDHQQGGQESIRIRLSDGRDLSIPVSWRVQLPFDVTPREILLFGITSSQIVDRSVFVKCNLPVPEQLSLIAAPLGFDAVVERVSDRLSRIRIRSRSPMIDNTETANILLLSEKSQIPISIPVRYVP
jgi:hypothetical protein